MSATVDSLNPLYNVENEQVAWYVKLSTGAYAVVNNDANNPAVIEFGDAPSEEIEAIYKNNENATVVYNEVYDAKLVKDEASIRKAKGLRQNFPELKSKDTYLKNIITRQKNRIRNDNRVSVMSVGGYGFVDWHWILCVGYREYSNGGNYMRIVNGWDNTANKFYKINSGSLWISATEYWVK